MKNTTDIIPPQTAAAPSSAPADDLAQDLHDLQISHDALFDRCEELMKEQARWQEAIRAAVQQHAPAAHIDGGGCDSGDPLDLSLSEIGQGFRHYENRAYDALDELGLYPAIGESETCLDAMIRLFTSDDWEPDVHAQRDTILALRAEIEQLRGKQNSQAISATACRELAYQARIRGYTKQADEWFAKGVAKEKEGQNSEREPR